MTITRQLLLWLVLSTTADGFQPNRRVPWSVLPARTVQSPRKAATAQQQDLEPLGVGVRRDFGNRYPAYVSDIKDGLNSQSLATVLFLFFACLAPAIGFGSVLGQLTGGSVGVMEMVASTSISGVLYALFSAQPVQLIGPQGPVVAYIAALYQLASILGVSFGGLYAWTGLWTSVFLLGVALTSSSNFARHFTRWTDETFSVLVSVIFLQQAVRDVSRTFLPTQPLVALWTLVTSLLTLTTALTLKSLPSTQYLTKSIRKHLSNFAPAIGVLVGSYVAKFAKSYSGTVLPALSLPASKLVTTSGRPWLLSLGSIPVWARWTAAIPAALLATLLYLDQNITARLVNQPRFGQTKGKRSSVTDGMHGDMLVLSVLTAISSIFGLPWMCGAPTRSAAHVQALSITKGDEQVPGVLENRVSGSAIHACIGIAAVAAAPRKWLAQVPQSVLSGIFLYLGWTSLQGLQFWDRIKNLFKDTRDERFKPVHICVEYFFTVVQITCLYAMLRVTQSKAGVLSPLLIALLPLVRKLMIRSDLVDEEAMKVLDK